MATWSGLWNGVYNQSYSLFNNKYPVATVVNRLFRRSRTGGRVMSELFDTTIGAAAGSAALDQYKRRTAVATPGSQNLLGGKAAIETVTTINRNSDAADVTALKAVIRGTGIPTYPLDKSGNGSAQHQFPVGK